MRRSFLVIILLVIILLISLIYNFSLFSKLNEVKDIISKVNIPEKSTNLNGLISKTEVSILNETQCTSKGYKWVPIPGLCGGNPNNDCGYICDVPTTDGGNDCYSNDDCQGFCSCGSTNKDDTDSDGYLVGKCSFTKYFENSDCQCSLPYKSKTIPPYACA